MSDPITIPFALPVPEGETHADDWARDQYRKWIRMDAERLGIKGAGWKSVAITATVYALKSIPPVDIDDLKLGLSVLVDIGVLAPDGNAMFEAMERIEVNTHTESRIEVTITPTGGEAGQDD